MSGPLDNWTMHGYSEEEARYIIGWLRQEKRRLLRYPRGGNGSVAERLNVPRFVANQLKKKAKRFVIQPNIKIPKRLLTARYADVGLLDDLYPGRKASWRNPARRRLTVSAPTVALKDFSFVHNPSQTMEMLSEIIRIEGQYSEARIDFLDKECPDIGPYLVLQAVRRHLTPIFTGGSIEPDIQRVIEAVGLRAPLRMTAFSDPTDQKDIWPFNLKQRRPANTSKSPNRLIEPQSREVVADQLSAELDKWLEVVAHKRLGLSGRRLVTKMVGEVLDNAERHSQLNSNDGDWAVAGYLVKRKRGESTEFRIHLAMLSIGASISQTVARGPSAMTARMDRYVRSHKSAALSEELLQTIFALQDGVTQDHNAAAQGRGGTGFQDIIAFFGDLGATPTRESRAELAIISGNSCVKIAHPHLAFANPQQNVERELWLNTSNRPADPPDQACAFSLPKRLHGTLISMSIPLDQGYLEASADDHN